MNKKNKRHGFTLIEIIISLAILSIVILSILGAFTNGFSYIMNMGRRTKAIEQAKKVVDTIILRESTEMDFLYNIKTDNDFKTSFIDEINSGLVDGVTITNIVANISDLTSPDNTKQATFDIVNNKLYKVTITVQYNKGTKTITLTSLIPQGGNL